MPALPPLGLEGLVAGATADGRLRLGPELGRVAATSRIDAAPGASSAE